MKQRIITAIFFTLVMILGLFGGIWSFAGLFFFITIMSLIELNRLVPSEGNSNIRQNLGIVFSASPVVFAFAKKLLNIDWSLIDYIVVLIAFLFIFYMVELYQGSKRAAHNIGRELFSYVYIGLPYALLVLLAWWQGDYNPWLVLGLLLMVWLNDTGAYFAGSFLGKNKLAPKISPKKTWEGLVGGVLATLITSQILATYLPDYSRAQWLIMGFICSFGILGDLIESILKRGADVKDSGNLMPGHGGVLDRFDAFAFVIPMIFVYFYFCIPT